MTEQPALRQPLNALNGVLGSVEAVRNGRALYLLMGTFSVAGMLMAMAQSALARGGLAWAVVKAGGAFFAAFYGVNATGMVLMDEACGRPARDVADALRDAMHSAHRLLLVLLAAAALSVALVAGVSALLWLARPGVTGSWLGPVVFGAAVPAGVVSLGLVVLTLATVVAPLSAAACWHGLEVRQIAALVWLQVRQRLLSVALLTTAVALLSSAVAALIAGVVVSGGRLVAVLGVLVTGVDIPAQQLMGGLFGQGLRSLGATGATVVQSPHGAAALIGGGLVFALALVLPALVYLRGLCAVYLAVAQEAQIPSPSP
jgi:hypothetical protein